MRTWDIIAFIIFFIQYAGYQYIYFFLAHKLKRPIRETTIQRYREEWLNLVIQSSQPILAIQTIRNLTMANTFMISLTMILMGGIVSIFSTNLNWLTALESGRYLDFLRDHPVAIKLLIALFMLLVSAFNFTFALRILYNMNFTTSASVSFPEFRSFQNEQVRRQARHFITGIRALYYFIGPIMWIIDPFAMILFSVTTTVLFYRFDFLKQHEVMTSLDTFNNDSEKTKEDSQ